MTHTVSAPTTAGAWPAADALFPDTAANLGHPRNPSRTPPGRAASQRPAITVYGCGPGEVALFRSIAPRFGVTATIVGTPPSAQSVPRTPGDRCVSVGHRTRLSRAILQAMKESGVEYVSTRSIGLDHIDLAAAAELGITVENVVYGPDGVADYTVMLILMALRNAMGILRAAADHDFRLPATPGRDLRDLTVGVVGTGRIGRAVIDRLHGFGCRVIAWDKARFAAAADYVSLPELLRQSDVVTLHLPLVPGTHHVIGADQISAMKRGAHLINTGRGGLVDTAALVDALEDGRLGGAALDVLEGEDGLFYADCTGRPVDHPQLLRLEAMPNVIVTPHTAYYTERGLHDAVTATMRNCLSFERSRAHD